MARSIDAYPDGRGRDIDAEEEDENESVSVPLQFNPVSREIITSNSSSDSSITIHATSVESNLNATVEAAEENVLNADITS